MAFSLRACLFDQGRPSDSGFRNPFQQFHGLHIVAECATWEALHDALQFSSVDLIIANLDGVGERLSLEIIQRVAELFPDCSVIGVSQSNNADTVIAAMRAGCHQFVRWPIDLGDFQAALDRIRATRLPAAIASKRFCVIGSSGGAGATTVACNLAIELAHLVKRRCGLVDLNLDFGDIACAFDCTPKYSIADVCRDGVDVDRVFMETALHELPCNVSIVARPEKLADARGVTPEGVEQMLRIMGQMFPFVTVDLPRAYSFLSAAALHGADRILIVTQLAVPFLRNATRIYECLVEMGAKEDRLEIVLNRCNANHERITPDEVKRHFARPIFAIIPNDYRRVTASRDLGHPILTDAPNSPARLAIQQMARTLAGDHLAPDETEEKNGGLLGRFWKRKAPTRQSV